MADAVPARKNVGGAAEIERSERLVASACSSDYPAAFDWQATYRLKWGATWIADYARWSSCDYNDYGEEFANMVAKRDLFGNARKGSWRDVTMGYHSLAQKLLSATQKYCSHQRKRTDKSWGDARLSTQKGNRFRSHPRNRPKLFAIVSSNTARAIALLDYVAVRSDNAHGRCTDSARDRRLSQLHEDVVRNTRDALWLAGACAAPNQDQDCPTPLGAVRGRSPPELCLRRY